MMVFSCLEAETRQLQSQTPNLSGMRVWTKLKFLWNQDRLKELLSALRGQQSSIKFLIQVLEMWVALVLLYCLQLTHSTSNTLSDIQRNIRDNVSKIQKPASEARSLRSNNPSVKMEAQSIFDNENTRLSLFDVGAISAVAPSELDFDFDDLVLNSQAYRRAFAQAQSDADLETQARGTEDIGLHLSGDATIRRINQDLVDLNLVTIVEPSSPRSVSTILERQESAPGDTDNPSLQQEEESTTLRDRTDVIAQELPNASELTTSSEHTCRKCSRGIIGQFVRKRGQTFHPDCFTCIVSTKPSFSQDACLQNLSQDCGEIIETRFSPLEDESYSQICEKDYYRRLGLLCHDCGQSLVGSYLTSGDKKYHLEHFKREISTVAIHTMDVAHAELLKAKEDEIRVFSKSYKVNEP